MTTLRIELHPKQYECLNSPATEILYGGAAGGGKSYLLRSLALILCHEVAGLQVYLFRRTYPDLIANHMNGSGSFPEMLGPLIATGQCRIVDNEIRFDNGSKIHLCHCQHEKDVLKYQGAEIHVLLIDELTHFCVTPDTDVMTRSGWVKIPEVKVGDDVATINENYEIEWHPASRVYRFDYDGDLVNISQRKGLSMRMTPNHRCVVAGQKNDRWSFVEAEKLPQYANMVYGGIYNGQHVDVFNIDSVSGQGIGKNQNSASQVDMNDWLEFLGWYLSEGSAHNKSASPTVSIRQTKKNESLDRLIARLPWRAKPDGDGGWLIFSRQLFNLLKPMGNLYEKRVPSFVYECSAEQREIFIRSFVAGDGHVNKHGGISIGLANKGLAEDIQRLFVLGGYKCSFTSTVTKDGFSVYRLYANKRRRLSCQVLPKDITREQYNGDVWCLTVEPNHNFIARHNGMVFVTGNTEYMYRFLRNRVRLGGLQVPEHLKNKLPLIISASNPGGIGHQWVKATFVNYAPPYDIKQTDKKEGGMLRQYIPAKLNDNPTLVNNDPGYINRLEGLGNESLVRAMKDGDWDIVAGAAFEKLSRDKHMIRPFEVPEHWTRFFCLDWGTAKPYAGAWYAVNDETLVLKAREDWPEKVIEKGSLIMYRELYGYGGNADVGTREESWEVARKIIDMETEKIDYRIADSAMWAEHDGPSAAENMMKEFARLKKAGKTDNPSSMEKSRKDRVANYLEIRNRLAAEEDQPGLYIFSTCEHFWRTVPDLQLDERNPEKGWDTDQEDHIADQLGYACVSRPVIWTKNARVNLAYDQAREKSFKADRGNKVGRYS